MPAVLSLMAKLRMVGCVAVYAINAIGTKLAVNIYPYVTNVYGYEMPQLFQLFAPKYIESNPLEGLLNATDTQWRSGTRSFVNDQMVYGEKGGMIDLLLQSGSIEKSQEWSMFQAAATTSGAYNHSTFTDGSSVSAPVYLLQGPAGTMWFQFRTIRGCRTAVSHIKVSTEVASVEYTPNSRLYPGDPRAYTPDYIWSSSGEPAFHVVPFEQWHAEGTGRLPLKHVFAFSQF